MSGDRWRPEGPPEEAYSRVTRDLATLYAPLIETARGMLDELETRHDVERRPASPAELARIEGCAADGFVTTVLAPRSPDQSPLIVGLCDLPGVHLAYGRWASEHLPECGCDACDETLEDLLELLTETRNLVVGGFAEWVRRTDGEWWVGHQDVNGFETASSLDRKERRGLGITDEIELTWLPWTRR